MQLTYGLSKILLQKMTPTIHSRNGLTHINLVVADFRQKRYFFPYLFIFCQGYILRTSADLMKVNYCILKAQEADNIP